MPKRNIVLYIHGLSGGGAERVWAVLAGALADLGHNVTLAVDFEAHEQSHHPKSSFRTIVLGGNHAATIRKLALLLRRDRPDIVMSAVAGSNLKLSIAKLLSATRVPILLTYHGFGEHKSGLIGRLGVYLLFALSRLADRTIAVSDGLRSHLVTHWHASPGRTRRIYNPVATRAPVSLPTSLSLADRPDVIVAVGRLATEKDVPTLLHAFSLLKRRDARLVLLGDGPERARIEALIETLGLAGRVELAGYQKEPWAYYERAKCLAHASKEEAFGNIVVEAMTYGLPVVVTDTIGPGEILDHGRYGRTVPVGDAAGMAESLDEALAAPGDPAPRMARAAEFSVATGAAAYVAMIEEVLAERQHR